MRDLPNSLLCGHPASAIRQQGFRARCGSCGSFWDLDYCNQQFNYDDSYPENRGHFKKSIGQLKVRSFDRYIKELSISLEDKITCEVGFGGASCLIEQNKRSKVAYGIEATLANIENAKSLGFSSERLFRADELPESLPKPVDLWFFFDSFEHIPDPAFFLEWIYRNSSSDAQIVLVAPKAMSPSERLCGRMWPHKISDHIFHWSQQGLTEFFARYGFRVERSFFPLKYVSLRMVFSHLGHKMASQRLNQIGEKLPNLIAPFNIGQMGLLLRRK